MPSGCRVIPEAVAPSDHDRAADRRAVGATFPDSRAAHAGTDDRTAPGRAPTAATDRRRTGAASSSAARRIRRAEDRIAHQEKVLLARALDILASDAERRGAPGRAAPSARARPSARGASPSSPTASSGGRRSRSTRTRTRPRRRQLAAWLDANAPRSRARRAAAGRAPISFIVGGRAHVEDPSIEEPRPLADDLDVAATHRARTKHGWTRRRSRRSAPLRDPADPDGGRRRSRLRVRPPGRCRPARRASPADDGPPRRASPCRSSRSQLAGERELAKPAGPRCGADDLRLDRRPRAADAPHGPARLPRADPRRPGPRPVGRARLPRAQPVDRRAR